MIALIGLAAVIGVLFAVARNQRRRHALDTATVELGVDDEGVTRVLGDGRRETVRWATLTEVEVLTVDSGPHAADGAVLVLSGSDGDGCLVPATLAVERGVVERLHGLPGFDGRLLVQALEAEPPARTTCWARR